MQDISNNNITQLGNLPTLAKWDSLDVSNNPISGTIPDSYDNLVNIQYLNFDNTLLKSESQSVPAFMTNTFTYDLADLDDKYICPKFTTKNTDTNATIILNPNYYDYIYCQCLPNHYGSKNTCKECPTSCECKDGTSIKNCFASPSLENVKEIVSCPVPETCQQNRNDDEISASCSEGYEGRVCSKCADGYGMRGKRCVECSDFETYFYIVVVICMVVFDSFTTISAGSRWVVSS
jgi:hypothetical protein